MRAYHERGRRPDRVSVLLVCLAVLALAPCAGLGADTTPSGAGGTITGTVKVTADDNHADDATSEMDNVVVYLDGLPEGLTFPPPTQEGSMRQRKKHFIPYILPIQKGTRVRFPNDDDLFHNVFSLSKTLPFDIGQYPKGPGLSLVFNQVGRVRVFCKIHSIMKANILVLPSPYFVQPKADGTFKLENVPAGTYFVVAWHEHLKQEQQQVTVKSGQSLTLDFNIH